MFHVCEFVKLLTRFFLKNEQQAYDLGNVKHVNYGKKNNDCNVLNIEVYDTADGDKINNNYNALNIDDRSTACSTNEIGVTWGWNCL